MLIEPTVRRKYTTEQIIEAIKATKGNARAVAALLGEKESTVRSWLLYEPLLTEARDKARGIHPTFAVSVTSRPKDPHAIPRSDDVRPVHEQPHDTPPRPTHGAINDRILIISDTHAPYTHMDALEFLAALHQKHKFTRIVHIGDEADLHKISYHDKDPNLPNASLELQMARVWLHELERLFPEMDILKSNHGDLAERKMITNGMPAEMLVPRATMYKVGGGWHWHNDMIMTLPTGYNCMFVHGRAKNVFNNSKAVGMSFVQGHWHSELMVKCWRTPRAFHFGMNVGCLIDRKALAFRYAKENRDEQLIGCGMILSGVPLLAPMFLNDEGRWTGLVP
jgi:hypothetical protein